MGANPTEAKVVAIATSVFVPNLETQLQQIRALEPPKDDRDEIATLEKGLDAAIRKLKADPALLAERPTPVRSPPSTPRRSPMA